MLSYAFLLFLGSQLVKGSDLPVKCATDEVLGSLGSSVVLPCWLNPPLNVEDMEIRWYRPNHYREPVLLYLNRKIVSDQQEDRYRNRSSLSLREEHSTGLKGGDVSIRLENLTLADQGVFNCFVSGDNAYGTGTLSLNLIALGSSPVLSLQPQGDLINVTCRSCGWLPRPEVEWKSDKQTTLHTGGLIFSQDVDELTCVHSWVLRSPSKATSVSCYISLSGVGERDGHVDIRNIVAVAPTNTEDREGPWKALFVVAVLAVVALLGLGVYFYRKYKTGYVPANRDEEAKETGSEQMRKERVPSVAIFMTACPKTNMEELRREAVSIKLLKQACQYLTIKDKAVRDGESAADTHEGPGFPYHLSVRGTDAFSSGRAYWEVALTLPNTAPKTSWLIGVTSASDLSNLPKIKNEFTPSKGFWFLYSSKETGLNINSEPEVSLPTLTPMPEIIGVFLDYDQGELSFYNAKEGIHLVTMKTQFHGEVAPLFNPGINDKAPLKIHDIKTQPKV
ncbi:butyrophilin subfamily 1 member A1-like [Brachyhypopomus gauderio]|uniref:butyrophilin subfamily 1 member A1-like n=1 Tax=Brachyhypopomus gauderio TaxID=698409 RepID=UPI004042E6E1